MPGLVDLLVTTALPATAAKEPAGAAAKEPAAGEQRGQQGTSKLWTSSFRAGRADKLPSFETNRLGYFDRRARTGWFV